MQGEPFALCVIGVKLIERVIDAELSLILQKQNGGSAELLGHRAEGQRRVEGDVAAVFGFAFGIRSNSRSVLNGIHNALKVMGLNSFFQRRGKGGCSRNSSRFGRRRVGRLCVGNSVRLGGSLLLAFGRAARCGTKQQGG